MTRTTNITGLIAAFLSVMLIHEVFHVATGLLYGEFDRFKIHPYGFEVIFKTPVEQAEGFKWFVISGTSNIITTLLGYLMLLSTDKFVNRPLLVRSITY